MEKLAKITYQKQKFSLVSAATASRRTEERSTAHHRGFSKTIGSLHDGRT